MYVWLDSDRWKNWCDAHRFDVSNANKSIKKKLQMVPRPIDCSTNLESIQEKRSISSKSIFASTSLHVCNLSGACKAAAAQYSRTTKRAIGNTYEYKTEYEIFPYFPYFHGIELNEMHSHHEWDLHRILIHRDFIQFEERKCERPKNQKWLPSGTRVRKKMPNHYNCTLHYVYTMSQNCTKVWIFLVHIYHNFSACCPPNYDNFNANQSKSKSKKNISNLFVPMSE